MSISRRQFLSMMSVFAASTGISFSQNTLASVINQNTGKSFDFSYAKLIEQAKVLAHSAYEAPPRPDSKVLDEIDWEHHGQIQFDTDHALFANGPGEFPISFFHQGRFFRVPVRMFVLNSDEETTQAQEIIYHSDLFKMPENNPAHRLGPPAAFAGFRIQESRLAGNPHLNWRDNDWAAFLGASYFRAIGDEYQYGLSARGVAINVVVDGVTEEFPDFTHFYFVPPKEGSNRMVIYALLDGPSIAGAYRFTLTRHHEVVMEIEHHLFLRQDVQRLGLAPITSMYWFSEKDKKTAEDWRPAVHDSDGLMMWTGKDEHLWRPLNNPTGIQVSSFNDSHPKGYGLMQRERHFSEYQDAVHYEKRPSLWVEPLGNWNQGSVELVELHTSEELYDNMVVMWVPQEKALRGQSYHLHYRLYWQANYPFPLPLAQVYRTSIGRGGEPGVKRPPEAHKFMVEFHGDIFNILPQHTDPFADLWTSKGRFDLIYVERVPNAEPHQWRVIFDLILPQEKIINPVELRLTLKFQGSVLSETWMYQYLVS
ncbi:MAG: glucan biosynthesis protein D [Ferrovum sp. 37-45-19]|nr:MAG: glucan biosynthesis protein D [Ferrovum sp. 21-44-67]OYV95524.1 MAG: glucan biosynthesis protein D [Ferrovum sp. 37-45-19]HQT81322.1 glucan biosynthesis protein D [Ferrovaceae bacterium]HQU05775.1 glucan biosynthesis protein D [Ferrovaceae bacterium]